MYKELFSRYSALPASSYSSYPERYELLRSAASELLRSEDHDAVFARTLSKELRSLGQDMGSARGWDASDAPETLYRLALQVARVGHPPLSRELVPYIEGVLYHERDDAQSKRLQRELEQIARMDAGAP
jgi:hypothetical protein